MAKKATTKPVEAAKKPPAKRKPRAKKPIEPAIKSSEISEGAKKQLREILNQDDSTTSGILSAMKSIVPCLIALAIGAGGGIWAAGGIPIGPKPTPGPVHADVLQSGFTADRSSQVAVLRELETLAYDHTSAEGRRTAVKFFNDNRFRNRAADYKPFTDAVADAIFNDSVAALADKLEGKP